MAINNEETTTVREIKPKNRRIMGGGGPDDEDFNKWPPWLKSLLRERFFIPCKYHADSHKSECNMYCLDCMNGSLCSLCLPHHRDHRTIQIRRSSYHDVIRVNEIEKVMDVSGVQSYIINSARVVFLNERPQAQAQAQARPAKSLTNTCHVCLRTLLHSFHFCSLACKVVGTSKNFQSREKFQPSVSDSEDSYNTSSATVNHHGHHRQGRKNTINNNNMNKMEQSFTPSTPPPTCSNYKTAKRRKGIPHRAPFGGLFIEY